MKKICLFLICLLLVGCHAPVEPNNIMIKNDYFSIELPIEWEGHYVYETIKDEMGYAIVLYETNSYQSGFGGHIMTISLYTSAEDYEFLPSYEKIGTLKKDNVSYDLIIEYPTDVQFSEEHQENYSQLVDDTDDIIASIQPQNDYVFTLSS